MDYAAEPFEAARFAWFETACRLLIDAAFSGIACAFLWLIQPVPTTEETILPSHMACNAPATSMQRLCSARSGAPALG